MSEGLTKKAVSDAQAQASDDQRRVSVRTPSSDAPRQKTDAPAQSGDAQTHASTTQAQRSDTPAPKMRTVLICHEADALDREGMARWLASFTELAGLIVLRETKGRMGRRVRREIKRVGALRFLDVLAFRLYYKMFVAEADRAWREERLAELRRRYPVSPEATGTRTLYTHSPNSPEAESFIRELQPDVMIARCKTLLKESIFTLPSTGTFVMHPGVCPEYRNAHGCFWALATGDRERVGMTLLRVDRGVDTGPVFGYYSYEFDEATESHARIQARVVFDNLDALETKLAEIHRGEAVTVETSGRESAVWGQPWLSSYLRWKRRARRARRQRAHETPASGADESRARP